MTPLLPAPRAGAAERLNLGVHHVATEQQIQIAAKLYEARRTLRRLFGDDYAESAGRWMDLLRQHAKRSGLDTIPAALDLIKNHLADNERSQLWLMAAAVEVIEPDDETPETGYLP